MAPRPRKQLLPAPQPVPVGTARKPMQSRSRLRFAALLDAVTALLAEKHFTQIGLYDIAERASVPPASVYHFFPTKEAAFLALAERYLVQLGETVDAPADISQISGWSDLVTLRATRTVAFYEANPVAAKIFLSGAIISEIRQLDLEFVSKVSLLSYDWFNRYFEMPYISNAEMKFSIVIAIFDGVWMTSYGRHSTITAAFAAEANRAALAYCRTFLPEVIAQRAPEE